MEKKIAGILLASFLVLGLCGCSGTPNEGGNEGVNGGEVSDSFDPGKEITVVSREASSGTRGAFDELMGIIVTTDEGAEDRLFAEAVIVDSTDAVSSKVEVDKYAVGYTSLGAVSPAVKAVSVDGTEATTVNVKNGTYKIARPFILATKGAPGDLAKDFIKYITSKQGQETANSRGYIESTEDAQEYAPSGLSGKLTLGGSTSVEKLIEKLKEDYIALNPGVDIEVQYTGSGTGIKDCIEGKVDIAMSSRGLKDSEKAELFDTTFAIDAIAVIVNAENPVSELTSDEINAIFTGGVRSWSEIS